MMWRVPLDRFQAPLREERPALQLPVPARTAPRPERHPAQTWVFYFTDPDRVDADDDSGRS